MSFFVYILQCADTTYYVGCTNNLERRIHQHNNTKHGAHYTKLRRPVMLKHHETYPTLAEARKREAEIKKWQRKRKEKLFHKSP
ncbi:MAG: GIY-YIG nuclease family protein [bacterium]|nr:GIY-YIG nuclease family protein [bacterium]